MTLFRYSWMQIACPVLISELSNAPLTVIRKRGPRLRSLVEWQTLRGFGTSRHLFRDCAATTLARLSTESARLIHTVLAHSGFWAAGRHYIHAQTIDAGRDYAAVVRRLKKGR
jgi:hypothetical protein